MHCLVSGLCDSPNPKIRTTSGLCRGIQGGHRGSKKEVSSDWNRVLTRDQNPLIIPIGCSHLVWGFVVEGLGFTARA